MSIKSCLASVALVLTAVATPTTASRSAECSFEHAVDIQTAFTVTNLDATLAGTTSQALQTAQQEFEKFLAHAPQPCVDEMIANTNRCANNLASDTLLAIGITYAATGDRAAYISNVRAIVNRYVRSLPRECWLVQIQFLPPTPPNGRCPAQQQHAACEAEARAELQRCAGRPKNMGPCPMRSCGVQPNC
jgi:hypothetical protein